MQLLNKAVNLIKLSESLNNNKDSYDCNKCIKREYYKERNCSGNFPPVVVDNNNTEVRFVVDENTAINYCPIIDTFDMDVIDVMNLYLLFKKGFLLKHGGVEDQPYWYVEAMLKIMSVDQEMEIKRMKNV